MALGILLLLSQVSLAAPVQLSSSTLDAATLARIQGNHAYIEARFAAPISTTTGGDLTGMLVAGCEQAHVWCGLELTEAESTMPIRHRLSLRELLRRFHLRKSWHGHILNIGSDQCKSALDGHIELPLPMKGGLKTITAAAAAKAGLRYDRRYPNVAEHETIVNYPLDSHADTPRKILNALAVSQSSTHWSVVYSSNCATGEIRWITFW